MKKFTVIGLNAKGDVTLKYRTHDDKEEHTIVSKDAPLESFNDALQEFKGMAEMVADLDDGYLDGGRVNKIRIKRIEIGEDIERVKVMIGCSVPIDNESGQVVWSFMLPAVEMDNGKILEGLLGEVEKYLSGSRKQLALKLEGDKGKDEEVEGKENVVVKGGKTKIA